VTTESGPLWRVRLGPEVLRANAEKLKTQAAQALQVEAMVVTHP
jgi:cell division septation protein DedD